MPQSQLLSVKGLYSYPSHLGSVPNGALLIADNIVVNRDAIAESRRGFQIYGNSMNSTITDTAHQLFSYKNRLLRHWGTGAGTTLEVDTDGLGNFQPFSISINGTTHTSTLVDGISSTAELEIGMFVSGSGIQPNTVISSITDNNSLVLSIATLSSTTTLIKYIWDIQEVVPGLRIKSVEANGNFYFTTSTGIRKISVADTASLAGAIISNAGGVNALDLTVSLVNTPGGFLTPNTVVAYRQVWGITDANNNEILGTPSSRTVIRNTSGSATYDVDLSFSIPRGITTAYFYQIYRTAVFADPSGIQDPGDEEQLVYEADVLNSDLNTGTIMVLDITPENLREAGAFLYTNQNSAEGILQANDIPPLSTDITSFKGYNFYSNTSTAQTLNLSLLSISALVSGTSTLTITNGITSNTYTFKSQNFTGDTHSTTTIDNISSTATLTVGLSITDTVSNTLIQPGTTIVSIAAHSIVISKPTLVTTAAATIVTGYESITNRFIALSQFPTPAEQIDETARSLVHVINGNGGEITYALYLSGPSDLPGLILLQARNISQPAYHLTVDSTATGSQFSPAIPTSGSSVITTNLVQPNRIYYSKFDQPEAVPDVNFIDIGPKDKAIKRILALRDNLYVLKEDGVYCLSGLVVPFTVFPFDFSVIIKADDSAVVLNNQIYLASSQGITTITDTGASVISRPIENDITPLYTPQYTNFKTGTFGVSYESDRSYNFFTVTNTGDAYATQCYRYNTFTTSWTRLILAKRCGIVNFFDDLLYLGPTDINFIEQERKNFDRTDYADRQYLLTLGSNAVNGTTLSVPSTTNITTGDVVTQDQLVTINQYNQILTKLDRDSLLTDGNYTSVLTISPGINLSTAIDSLITKIANDSGRIHTTYSVGVYTALEPTPSTFSGQQTTFNALIALLNSDVGVGYKNYSQSTGVTTYEFIVQSVNVSKNTIVTPYVYPLIQGPITVFNHINVDLQWVPQFFQDSSMTKHVSEGTLIFEDSSFSNILLGYSTDFSGDLEQQAISGSGNGIFGNNIYGNGPYGGNGSGVPFRTFLPKEKQRCRYVDVNFQHGVAREIFSLYGLSLTWVPVSQRGYR